MSAIMHNNIEGWRPLNIPTVPYYTAIHRRRHAPVMRFNGIGTTSGVSSQRPARLQNSSRPSRWQSTSERSRLCDLVSCPEKCLASLAGSSLLVACPPQEAGGAHMACGYYYSLEWRHCYTVACSMAPLTILVACSSCTTSHQIDMML